MIIPGEISELIAQGAALLINHSGGKDSSVMLDKLCTAFPQAKKYVVFADTGFEHVKPVTAEEWARRLAARYGLELNVARNPNKNILTMIRERRMFPSPSCRQCTSDLKRDPIRTWMRRNVPENIIINCMGLRAQESAKRAKAQTFKKSPLSNSVRTVYEWLPIHDMILDQVLHHHTIRNIQMHPVYVWAGGYLRRFSCRLCIMMTNDEIRLVHEHDPEAFESFAALEKEIGFTMKPAVTLYQIAGIEAKP